LGGRQPPRLAGVFDDVGEPAGSLHGAVLHAVGVEAVEGGAFGAEAVLFVPGDGGGVEGVAAADGAEVGLGGRQPPRLAGVFDDVGEPAGSLHGAVLHAVEVEAVEDGAFGAGAVVFVPADGGGVEGVA